jgi:hypothetical protein
MVSSKGSICFVFNNLPAPLPIREQCAILQVIWTHVCLIIDMEKVDNFCGVISPRGTVSVFINPDVTVEEALCCISCSDTAVLKL